MTLILDSGGLSALAADRAKLAELRRRGLWPGQVPSVVLAESLTGDHRARFPHQSITPGVPGSGRRRSPGARGRAPTNRDRVGTIDLGR